MARVRIWAAFVALCGIAVVVMQARTISFVDAVAAAFDRVLAERTQDSLNALTHLTGDGGGLDAASLVANVALLVALIGWTATSNSVATQRGLHPQTYSPGWAVGAWFVPVLNVIRLPRILGDVIRAGRPNAPGVLIAVVWVVLRLVDLIYYRVVLTSRVPTTEAAFRALTRDITTSAWLGVAVAVGTVLLVLWVTAGYGREVSAAATRPAASDSWMDAPAGAPSMFDAPVAVGAGMPSSFGTPNPAFGTAPIGGSTFGGQNPTFGAVGGGYASMPAGPEGFFATRAPDPLPPPPVLDAPVQPPMGPRLDLPAPPGVLAPQPAVAPSPVAQPPAPPTGQDDLSLPPHLAGRTFLPE